MQARKRIWKLDDAQSSLHSQLHQHRQEPSSLPIVESVTNRSVQLLPDKTMLRSTRQNSVMQMQQNYGNHYVRRLLSQEAGRAVGTWQPSLGEAKSGQQGMDSRRVSRSRVVGMWRSVEEDYGSQNPVVFQARTRDEWIKFLKTEADETYGAMELYAFMLSATTANSDKHLVLQGAGVSEQEAVDLMMAFLSTGSDIDLPDKSDEGTGWTHNWMPEVMANFNAAYAGLAIQQMTRTKDGGAREFDKADVSNIAAYGYDAKHMPDFAMGGVGAGDAPNPALSLISAGVGSAFGAATQALQAGSDTKQQSFKKNAFILLRNSAMTIRGCLDALEAPASTPPTILTVAFNGAASALAAVSGFASVPTQIVAWGLSGVASSFFSTISIGGNEVKDEIRGLKDDFHKQLNEVKTVQLADGKEKPIENASDVETIKTIFDTVLNY